MTEKELLGQLKKLRQIEPQKNWAFLTKTQIMGAESKFVLFPYFKPAFAGLLAVFILFGFFGYGFVKDALPGDLLYTVKKIAHQGQAIFVSEQEKPVFQLKLANDRLEDLTKASARNLVPTIFEFQASIVEAAKDLSRINASTSDLGVIKQIVEGNNKLEVNRQKVKSFGLVLGDEGYEGIAEWDDAFKKMAENLIEDLGERTLTEEKEDILKQMEELSGEGKYSQALELYLINQ